MNETIPKRSLGSIETLSLNLDEFKMKDEINFNKLTLLIGANGTGKTLINVMNWALTTAINIHILTKNDLKDTLNEILSKSVDTKFTGILRIAFSSNVEMIAELENGNVLKAEVHNLTDDIIPINIKYMSTNMRTFNQINQYIKTKKLLTSVANADEIFEIYKFYDIYLVESYLQHLSGKKTISVNCGSDFDEKLEAIKFLRLNEDETEIEYGIEENGGLVFKSTSSLSNGEQSMLNMLVYPKL